METCEIYRMLAADHFELLTESEQARLRSALQSRPDVDSRRFRQELTTALASGQDGARTLAFQHGLEAAELQLHSGPPPSRWRPFRQIWRMGLAAVIGAGLAAAFLGRSGPPPAVQPLGQAYVLTAERSGAGDLDLDSTASPLLTLVVEARLETDEIRWELLDGDLTALAEGSVTLRGEPRLRTLAVTVPKVKLRPAANYWLILSDAEGATLRRWMFHTL